MSCGLLGPSINGLPARTLDEFALKPHQYDSLTIELSDNARTPMLGDFAQLRGKVDSLRVQRGRPTRRTRSSKRGSEWRESKPGRSRTPGLNRSSYPFSSQLMA